MSFPPQPPPAPLVACPNCKRTDGLYEQSFRATWQPVDGLRADGDADNYDSFDFGDDPIVCGYSCRCGWIDVFDLSKRELARLGRHTSRVLGQMPRVHGCELKPLTEGAE